MMTERIPHDMDAEQSVIGILISEIAEGKTELVYDTADQLQPEDFYVPAHKVIFENLIELVESGQPADFVTLATRVGEDKAFSGERPIAYLTDLSRSVASVRTLPQHIQRVRDESARRRMISLGNYLIRKATEQGVPLAEVLDQAERKVMTLSQGLVTEKKSLESIADSAQERWDYLYKTKDDPNVLGVETGFVDLDRMLGGVMPEYILLAARPSMGKTAFSLQVAENVARLGRGAVGYCSLEMATASLVDRSISAQSHIDQVRIRRRELSEEEWERGAQAVTHIAELQLYIDDAVTTTNEIRSFARRLKREYGLAMIVIDYLQLIADKPERGQNSQNDIVSAISRRLKQLTKELGCPFVVLSQLNRSTEKRGDHRPMLSDLRDSGSLEQDADQVWFIHRPDYYNPRDKPGTAELIIAKNRNGPVGTVELAFVRQYAKFGNLAQPEEGGSRGQQQQRPQQYRKQQSKRRRWEQE